MGAFARVMGWMKGLIGPMALVAARRSLRERVRWEFDPATRPQMQPSGVRAAIAPGRLTHPMSTQARTTSNSDCTAGDLHLRQGLLRRLPSSRCEGRGSTAGVRDRRGPEAVDRRPRAQCPWPSFSSPIIESSVFFASPSTIIVFAWKKSSFSTPLNPGFMLRLRTMTLRDCSTLKTGIP
jgi:hypothetical protein